MVRGDGGPTTVLYVAPDPNAASPAVTALERTDGIDVVTAGDADEALPTAEAD